MSLLPHEIKQLIETWQAGPPVSPRKKLPPNWAHGPLGCSFTAADLKASLVVCRGDEVVSVQAFGRVGDLPWADVPVIAAWLGAKP